MRHRGRRRHRRGACQGHACDPVSAYGGVVAANRPVPRHGRQLAEIFTEVVAAPAFDDERYESAQPEKNIRLLELPDDTAPDPVEFRAISGGVLAQTVDRVDAVVEAGAGEPAGTTRALAVGAASLRTTRRCRIWRSPGRRFARCVQRDPAGATTARASGSGWARSTGSTPAGWRSTGPGGGQGCVAASDAFFPFADGLQVLLDAGSGRWSSPAGRSGTTTSIAAAQAAGVTMYFTGTRHFTH